MKEVHSKDIQFTCIKLDNNCDKMITDMQKHHPSMQVTDLVSATKNKSAAEVTKMFVDSASYILRATIGGAAKGGKGAKSGRKAVKSGKTLWDPKKLETKDIFSCISYLKVDKIDGNQVTVTNQLGGSWFMTKDILERDM